MSLDFASALSERLSADWQETRSEAAAAADDKAIPSLIVGSRALSEVHRFDLALFVAFEEASVGVAEGLARHALPGVERNMIADQWRDDARHWEVFGERLDATLAVGRPDAALTIETMMLRLLQGAKDASTAPLGRADVTHAAVIPPLRRFFADCQERAAAGAALETLVLFNLAMKGMANALYDYERRYWQPVDPYLARLIRTVADDEGRHVRRTAQYVCGWLAEHPEERPAIAALCIEARVTLQEVFRYYIRKFVAFFGTVARQQRDAYAGVEFAPGRDLLATTEEEQVRTIQASRAARYAGTLAQAGLHTHGY